MVRLAVVYGATEKAGNWFPPCVSGMITVTKGTQVLWSGAPVCGSTLPTPDGRPYVYLDVYLAEPADLGAVDVQIALL